MKHFLLFLSLLLPLFAVVELPGASLKLEWIDNSNNETGFIVERTPGPAPAPTAVWTEVGRTAANVVTFTDQNLPNGATFSYRVKAFNTAGFSLWSNTATGTTADTLPAAPTTLRITPVPLADAELSRNQLSTGKLAATDASPPRTTRPTTPSPAERPPGIP